MTEEILFKCQYCGCENLEQVVLGLSDVQTVWSVNGWQLHLGDSCITGYADPQDRYYQCAGCGDKIFPTGEDDRLTDEETFIVWLREKGMLVAGEPELAPLTLAVTLSDGGYILSPDAAGVIHRRDSNGNCEEVRRPGDPGYAEWLDLFA